MKKKDENLELIKQLKQYRTKFEARWYITSAFYDGFHFSWGKQDKDGQWLQTPTPKGKVIRQIPKAKKHLNSQRNLLLKIRLKPVVYPDKNVLWNLQANGENTEAIQAEQEKAIKMGSYIDYQLIERMKIMSYKKLWIRKAQLMGHSFIQILNEDGEPDKMEFKVYDAFDISVPFGIDRIKDVACKHIAKSIDDLKKDESYDKKAIKECEASLKGEYSDSKYKQAMLSEKYGNAPENMVLLDELYQVIDDKVVITTYLGESKIKTQQTEMTKIPITMFVWDDTSYQTSVMEDLMPLNRAYDVFVSKLEHKVKKLDTGRLIVQKRETIKPITTKDGEIIRYKRFKPEIMQESQVSNAFLTVLNIVEADMKEQGVAVASGSDIPSGVKAWRAIESLKEADYASLGNQIGNMEDAMTDLVENYVSMLGSDMIKSEIAQIPSESETNETEQFKVIGKAGYDLQEKKEEDIVVIDPNLTVKVEHEAVAGWTEGGRRDLVIELVGANILPMETAIKMLEIGNTREIMRQVEMEITKGKSIIDMPDFKLLPKELQMAIVQYLSSGGVINDPDASQEDKDEVKKSVK